MQENTSSRKQDHIQLAFESQLANTEADPRFIYEPLLAGHPTAGIPETLFLDKTLALPIWISSMTGGTEKAGTINRNLAEACKVFKLGMGLGSCRIILDDDTYFADFDLRKILGEDRPFYANLGIAQVEQLLEQGKAEKILRLVDRLRADGLIVHVNPLQEWLQPEGDHIKHPPVEIIRKLIDQLEVPLIVKEVGQGMGPESLRHLMELPVKAIEFAAFGGTNFAQLELLRAGEEERQLWGSVARIGHSCEEMIGFVNEILEKKPELETELIISGGVKTFLDGFYYMHKVKAKAIYGQASEMLKHAAVSADAVCRYLEKQQKGLALAHSFLKIK